MLDTEKLRERLKKGDIILGSDNDYAATGLIISESNIIIERRSLALKDPWAGQFALPGGHFKGRDLNLLNTARREIKEETGIDVPSSALLGYFGPLSPRNRTNLMVFVFVFEIVGDYPLVQSTETDFLSWVPIPSIILSRRTEGNDLYFDLERGTIWGLTARMIETFLEMADLL